MNPRCGQYNVVQGGITTLKSFVKKADMRNRPRTTGMWRGLWESRRESACALEGDGLMRAWLSDLPMGITSEYVSNAVHAHSPPSAPDLQHRLAF